MTIPVNPSIAERAFRRPMAPEVRHRLELDIKTVFRMLNRSDWVREFILGSNVAADLLMLLAPLGAQSAFILDTEEHQEGQLTGSIAMRYLVVPSFSTPEGISGGAIATTYASRNHPLHHPNVMANTRIGRYVRDNATGEWLILTRNEMDNVTRLQWLHSSRSTTRERICLTCNTALFNKGLFVESMLFECHDEEWRPCPHCGAPPQAYCECSLASSALALPKHPLDLPTVAAAALGEPKSEWRGHVNLSILTNYRDLRGDVDARMNLRTSFEASQDAGLALQMQNLALQERAKSAIPKGLPQKLLANSLSSAAALGEHNPFLQGFQVQQPPRQREQPRQITAAAVPVSAGAATLSSRQTNGVVAQLEMFAREDKLYAMDAVVPNIRAPSHADKLAASVPDNVLGVVAEASDQPPPHGSLATAHAFDAVAMLASKHFQANGNQYAADNMQKHLQVVPNGHAIANGHSIPNEHSMSNGHAGIFAQSSPVDMATLAASNGFAPGPHPAESQHVASSHSSGSPRDDDDDEDETGVFDANPERHRMPSTKAFENFLGSFLGNTPTNAVDLGPMDTIDLGQGAWMNQNLPVSQPPASKPGEAFHVAPVHDTRLPNGHLANGHSAAAVPSVLMPDFGAPTSTPTHAPVAPKATRRPSSVRRRPPPPSAAYTPSLDAAALRPSRVARRAPSSGGPDSSASPESPDTDSPPAPLARLEPRPPGMSAGMEGAWLWHIGPRGPYGLAAIAAARERERRAEERRRKNREAAARSNARAKERILAIKGELEKNKDRISRLARRRKELEMQNSALKHRLTGSS